MGTADKNDVSERVDQLSLVVYFFFQAEDGIRDVAVTGVQTCALPIYEDAAAMFSHVVSLAPDSFTGYSNLGGVRAFEGKYAEAVPLFEKSLSIRPTGDARSNLATAYFQMHRYADSAAQFEQAVQLDSKNYIFWGNLGDAYYWAPGRRSEAPAAYGQAITIGEEKLRLNPNDAVLLSSLAIYHAIRA